MDISDWASWEERFAAFNQRNTAVAVAAHDPEHIRCFLIIVRLQKSCWRFLLA